ncbi:MAG: nucleic acid-binding protein [Isosphaeraceae bacterium]|nr:nucleic acid-binding protein [Isosphaeraceae bacterium]
MSATATNLRELHELHSRAKALRDRLASGPKTIAARTATLAARRAAVEAARKALQDAKVKAKTKEHQVQALQSKIDDHKVRLNTVKKNEEYKAIQNQIANEKNAITKLEDEQLEGMTAIETMTAELAKLERELETFAAEVQKLESDVASQSEGQKAQLAKLEAAIVEAEDIIPEDERERYRRTVKQRGADALAAVEGQACTGCFVTVTAQALNDLINRHGLTWCKTCGRVLYLGEDEMGSHR